MFHANIRLAKNLVALQILAGILLVFVMSPVLKIRQY
jgi:hypothetical protein